MGSSKNHVVHISKYTENKNLQNKQINEKATQVINNNKRPMGRNRKFKSAEKRQIKLNSYDINKKNINEAMKDKSQSKIVNKELDKYKRNEKIVNRINNKDQKKNKNDYPKSKTKK